MIWFTCLGIDVSPVVTELSPTHRVLDVAMAQVGLQGPRIVPLVGRGRTLIKLCNERSRSPKGRIHARTGRPPPRSLWNARSVGA